MRPTRARHADRECRVGKEQRRRGIVDQKSVGLVGEVADGHRAAAGPPRRLVDAHARPRPSLGIGHARSHPDLGESPAAQAVIRLSPCRHIVKEKIPHRVVGDKDVGPAVVIGIGNTHSQRLGDAPELLARHGRRQAGIKHLHAGRLRHVLKPAIARVAIERAGRAREIIGRAVGAAQPHDLEAELGIGRRRPGDVAADEEIQPRVAVVIEESRRRRPGEICSARDKVAGVCGGPAAGPAHAGRAGDIDESAAAIGAGSVAVEPITADARHEQIAPAVVVVIGRGRPHAVDRLGQPAVSGDVGKGAVPEVAKQAGGGERFVLRPGLIRPRTRVDEEDVAMSVAVVVKRNHARPHGLRQELAADGAGAVREHDARCGRDVGEGDPGNFDRHSHVRRRRHDDRIGLRWPRPQHHPSRRREQSPADQQRHQCQTFDHGAAAPALRRDRKRG